MFPVEVFPLGDGYLGVEFIEAAHLGFLLVDATHYATENIVVRPLTERIRRLYPNVYAAETVNPVRFC